MSDGFVNPITDDTNLRGKIVQVKEWEGPKLYRAANGRGCLGGAQNNPIQLGTIDGNIVKLKNKWVTRKSIVGWIEEEDLDKALFWMALQGQDNNYD